LGLAHSVVGADPPLLKGANRPIGKRYSGLHAASARGPRVKRGLLTSFQDPLGIHKPVELDGLGHQPGPADLVAGKLPTELIDVAMRNLGVQVVWCDSYRDVCRNILCLKQKGREIDLGPRSSYSSTSWTP
jgi:hypothetical protein